MKNSHKRGNEKLMDVIFGKEKPTSLLDILLDTNTNKKPHISNKKHYDDSLDEFDSAEEFADEYADDFDSYEEAMDYYDDEKETK